MTIATGQVILAADILAIQTTANGALTGSATANAVLVGAGGVNVGVITPGAAGQAVVSNGASASPVFRALTHSDISDWAAQTAGFITGTPGVTSFNTRIGPVTPELSDVPTTGAAAGYVLTFNGSVAQWEAASGGGVTSVPVVTAITPATDTVVVNVGGSGGTTEQITMANALAGKTVDQLPAAATPSATDTILVGQGSSNTLAQPLSALLVWIESQLPFALAPVVEITTNPTAIDRTFNNKIISATQPLTITTSFVNLSSGFRATLFNDSAGIVTLGTGFTGAGGVTSLAPGGRASIEGYTNSVGSYARVTPNGSSLVAPTAATGLTSYGVGPTAVALTWVAPSGSTVASYTVQYQANGASSWSTVSGIAGTSCTITGLTASTTYLFQVQAVNAIGASPWTSSYTIATPATLAAPGAVSNLINAASTSTSVTLTWTPPTSGGILASYAVGFRVTSVGGAYTIANAAIATPTYVVTGLSVGTAYDFEVYAINATGTGTPATLGAQSTTTAPPGQVVGLAAGTATATSVPLTWTATATATGYTVTYTPAGGSAATTTTTTNSATLTGLTAATTYAITVVATSSAGSGSPSSAVSATTLSLPAQVTGLTVGTISGTSVPLSWTAVTGATGYTITYTPTGGSAQTTTATTNAATLTGLAGATTYLITVAATSAAGTGPASAAQSATTGSAPAFAITSVTPNALGAVGSSLSFTATYTGTAGSLTATVDGASVTPTSITVTGSGTGTFSLPSMTAGTHAISVTGGSATVTTQAWFNTSASIPYNMSWQSAGAVPPTSYTGSIPTTISGGVYWFVSGGTGTYVDGQPGSYVNMTAASQGLSSLHSPPTGSSLIANNQNSQYGQYSCSGPVYAAGTYYYWSMFTDPSGNQYAMVYPTPIVCS